MARERFLRTLRALAACYHAFERLSAPHVRSLGYTPAQFDIIATLGNTAGMSFKELGDLTLITKGTLTGVVDRLEAMGIVRRQVSKTDGRSTIVRLTARGDAEFSRVFGAHVGFLKRRFDVLSEKEMELFDALAGKLRHGLAAAVE